MQPRIANSTSAASRISSRRTSALFLVWVSVATGCKLLLTYRHVKTKNVAAELIWAVSTAVVSGGAGFLGSHLCDYLLAKGHRVICVDNLDTGSLQNIEHLQNSDDFLFVNHDVTEPFFIEERIDYVFHLASPASPIDYLRLPLHTLKVGSYGTHNMLGLAKFKRARFLSPRRARSTATRRCTRSPRPTGAT